MIPYQNTCSSSSPCMTYVRALRCPLNHLGLVSYSHVWLSNYIIWCCHYSCRLKDVESLAYVFDGDRLDWEHRLDAGLCQGESARRGTQGLATSQVVYLKGGEFIIPGFIDTHTVCACILFVRLSIDNNTSMLVNFLILESVSLSNGFLLLCSQLTKEEVNMNCWTG